MALATVHPLEASDTSLGIDIVAVHGLGGDAVQSWTHPSSKAFWLKDFLPQQIPDARIMTFGYDSDKAFGQTTAEVTDIAKRLLASLVDKREESEELNRPVAFIAHSLGGIVVKEALLQARLDVRYNSICDSTLGIIFLGTPHCGSEKVAYGKVLANIVRCTSNRRPSRLLAALKTNSDVLLRLTTDFRHQLPDYHVYSFYEQRPMGWSSSLVVEKHSALLDIQHEEQIPVQTNHRMLCKFETDSDDTFEKVYKRIRRMRTNPLRKPQDKSVSYSKHFQVPHLLSPVFTGREEGLRRLKSALAPTRRRGETHQRRFVLFGLGGSGKTQICLKYAQDSRERYWGIFWIDASSEDRIQHCFTEIAQNLQVTENVDSVKQSLANITQTWLLVFDNADDPDLSLAPYLPPGDRGDIIITSRHPGHRSYNTVGYEEIGRLSFDDAVTLLNKVAEVDMATSPEFSEVAEKIVETLGYLALAIVQAGAYIRETCTLQGYLKVYEKRKKDLLQYQPKHLGTDYRYTVFTTWQLSVDMIGSRNDTTSVHTLHLLKLLGFYHHDQIPVRMFVNAWQASADPKKKSMDLPWHDSLSNMFDYEQAVQASLALLASFSLISRNSDVSISLHPLVHEWCRERIPREEQQMSYGQAFSLLANSVPQTFNRERFNIDQCLESHAHELLRSKDRQDLLEEDFKVQHFPSIVLILHEAGWTRDVVGLMQEVLRIQQCTIGDHPDTMKTMGRLCILYDSAGRKPEAVRLAEEVFEFNKSKYGEEHPDTLINMGNLAALYSGVGRKEEGLQLTEKVIELYRKLFGESDPRLQVQMANLIDDYCEAGRFLEAVHVGNEAYRFCEAKYGLEHEYTLGLMQTLSKLYSQIELHEEALNFAEHVYDQRIISLGEEHPHTLTAMSKLGLRCGNVGLYAEGLELTEKALKLQIKKIGEHHPHTLHTKFNLVNRYTDTGQLAEALQLGKEVVILYKNNFGIQRHTISSMYNLAIVYERLSRREDARQLMEEVVRLSRSTLGDHDPETVEAVEFLGKLCQPKPKAPSHHTLRHPARRARKRIKFWRSKPSQE